MKNKSKVFLIISVTVVIGLTIVLSKWRIEYERNMYVDFEVAKVEITPALRVVLYDKDENKLRLQRFVFYDRHCIKPGDLIYKEVGSNILSVFRIDSLGNQGLYMNLFLE